MSSVIISHNVTVEPKDCIAILQILGIQVCIGNLFLTVQNTIVIIRYAHLFDEGKHLGVIRAIGKAEERKWKKEEYEELLKELTLCYRIMKEQGKEDKHYVD